MHLRGRVSLKNRSLIHAKELKTNISSEAEPGNAREGQDVGLLHAGCELFEGSARKALGPNVCLREVGGDCRAARGQSGHASTAATFKCHQNNSVRFAGSAQMFAQAGSLRARPMAEVATCTCLHICTMAPAACCAVSAQHTVQAKWWWVLPA